MWPWLTVAAARVRGGKGELSLGLPASTWRSSGAGASQERPGQGPARPAAWPAATGSGGGRAARA
jgi:hypothetical protein